MLGIFPTAQPKNRFVHLYCLTRTCKPAFSVLPLWEFNLQPLVNCHHIYFHLCKVNQVQKETGKFASKLSLWTNCYIYYGWNIFSHLSQNFSIVSGPTVTFLTVFPNTWMTQRWEGQFCWHSSTFDFISIGLHIWLQKLLKTCVSFMEVSYLF